MRNSKLQLGIVGARGHTGVELLRLVERHPALQLSFVSSRELAGQPLQGHVTATGDTLCYENLAPEDVAHRGADAVILALPNGKSKEFVEALDVAAADALIIDLSADHRFDEAWYYGLPELARGRYAGEKRISNPGCYATAMQLAIAPLKADLAAPPACFGVSGYSGAGTAPSDRNDADKLRDNLMAYSLIGHVHERETARHLGIPVEFMPHVAAHFRGISMTVNLWLQRPTTRDEIVARYRAFYAEEPLIHIVDEAPWVSLIAGQHHVEIGAFALAPGGTRVVIVTTLDNLLKGAATQAMQNLNIAFGIDEFVSIVPSPHSGEHDKPE